MELIGTLIILFIIIWAINNWIIYYIYKNFKEYIKSDIKNGEITDYNKLLLNINNKISNIEKEIKELKDKQKEE